jgi:beta-lactamase regulating signal transducer with metallopeptidase domain
MEMFLVDVAVKATVVLAGAFGATWGMRRSSAAARHWVWVLAFVALLVLPMLAAVLPAWRILPSWSPKPNAVVVENTPAEILSPQRPLLRAARADVRAITKNISPVASEHSITVPAVAAPASSFTLSIPGILNVYSLGSAIFLLPIFAGMLALVRLERKSARLNQAPWLALLANLLARLGIRRNIAIFESPSAMTMPMTWGVWRSRILLPATAQNWSAERRRLVLLHELAHAKRRDAATQFLARLVCAMCWLHPLAWLALRQLRIEAEIACDDLVLAADTKPSIYAAELLDIVSVHRGLSFLSPAVAMARGNHPQIHSRIRAILDHARNRRAVTVGTIVCMTAAAMLVLLPVAALRAQETKAAFPHVAHFDLGNSQFLPGESIRITEIRGTADIVTPGNTYQIKGTYTLASAEEANLATYVTGSANDKHHDPYDQRQTVAIKKGSGTFTVVLPFISKGSPHLSFYPTDGGQSFSALYFGSGDSLWKTGASVLILVSPTGISFEGEATTWEALPALLEKVPNRQGAILAFALTSDQMTVAQYHEAFAHVAELGTKFHFRYVSGTGIKAAPSASATTQPTAQLQNLFDPSEKAEFSLRDGKVRMQNGKKVTEVQQISAQMLDPADATSKHLYTVDVDNKNVRFVRDDGSFIKKGSEQILYLSRDGKMLTEGNRIEISAQGVTADGWVVPAVGNMINAKTLPAPVASPVEAPHLVQKVAANGPEAVNGVPIQHNAVKTAASTTQPAAGFDPYGKTIIAVHNGKVQMQFQDGKILFEADKFIKDGNSFVAQGNGTMITKPGAKFATVPTTMPTVP